MQPQDRPKVLLLEDDALINLSTTDMIMSMGYTVRSCLNVADAVQAAHEDLPDVAVLDVNIAGTTSYVLADWLRHRGVQLIFVTGYETVAPSALRAAPLCRKPCSEDQLRGLIADALNRPASP